MQSMEYCNQQILRSEQDAKQSYNILREIYNNNTANINLYCNDTGSIFYRHRWAHLSSIQSVKTAKPRYLPLSMLQFSRRGRGNRARHETAAWPRRRKRGLDFFDRRRVDCVVGLGGAASDLVADPTHMGSHIPLVCSTFFGS